MTWVPPPPPLSAPAAMASPLPMVTVVGPQFCAPYVVALTITKKALSLSDGDFIVSDVNGTVLMKVLELLVIGPLSHPPSFNYLINQFKK
jgi:LURP-one-related